MPPFLQTFQNCLMRCKKYLNHIINKWMSLHGIRVLQKVPKPFIATVTMACKWALIESGKRFNCTRINVQTPKPENPFKLIIHREKLNQHQLVRDTNCASALRKEKIVIITRGIVKALLVLRRAQQLTMCSPILGLVIPLIHDGRIYRTQ